MKFSYSENDQSPAALIPCAWKSEQPWNVPQIILFLVNTITYNNTECPPPAWDPDSGQDAHAHCASGHMCIRIYVHGIRYPANQCWFSERKPRGSPRMSETRKRGVILCCGVRVVVYTHESIQQRRYYPRWCMAKDARAIYSFAKISVAS